MKLTRLFCGVVIRDVWQNRRALTRKTFMLIGSMYNVKCCAVLVAVGPWLLSSFHVRAIGSGSTKRLRRPFWGKRLVANVLLYGLVHILGCRFL